MPCYMHLTVVPLAAGQTLASLCPGTSRTGVPGSWLEMQSSGCPDLLTKSLRSHGSRITCSSLACALGFG